MDTTKSLSSATLNCELKIMNAQLPSFSTGYLFVRCYLSAGNNKRVRVGSRQVSAKGSDVSWNQSFFLDCFGTKQSMDMIAHGTIVLELRWRSCNAIAFFGRSKLVGRNEMSWRGVLDSPNMEIETNLKMESKKKLGLKCPSLRVGMKLVLSDGASCLVARKMNKWDEKCACCVNGDCCNTACVDSDLFFIGAALDAF